MYIFAYMCLLAAFLCSVGGGVLALVWLWKREPAYLSCLRWCHSIIVGCLLLASALLLHALFWQDYRLEYVSNYTDSFLPVFYRLTAFWAGQPGSLLFWALVTAIFGLIFSFIPQYRRLNHDTLLWYWCFFFANMAFFCLLLTGWSNPFIAIEPVPADGNGLNPLLQNPGMIFHPPLLFAGYAGFTVPACLALAQCLANDSADMRWFKITRPFIILSWIFLTAGIVLGAWWAYMELGWGGYWAWDPVENASLLPWLCATAAIHLLALDNRSGKLDRSSVALMALTVVAAYFATYLTRSGVIQSVHAFGDGGVGTPLLVFIAFELVISVYIAFSARETGQPLASPVSREGSLVLVAWIFMALFLIISIATMWPVLSRIGGSATQGLDATFYNRVCLPLCGLLFLLLAICTWLGWDGSLAPGSARRCYATCGAFAASLAAIWVAGYRQPLALISASAAIAALCAMFMHIFDRNLWRSKRAVSALGAHIGIAILAVGVSFSGPYSTEKELLLAPGQKETVGAYTVALESVKDGSGPGYDYLKATLEVNLGKEKTGILMPERRIYAKFGSMQFSEVDVIYTLGQDIYASLLGMDEDYRALVRISLEPMVNWIWLGGTLMCLLPLFGLWRLYGRKNV